FRGFRIQRACGIRFEFALIPLLSDGEIERARHDQDGTKCIGMPMGHNFHPRWKFDAVDVQTGLRRVAAKRYVLRRPGESFVDDVLWKLDDGVDILSVSGPPCSGRVKSEESAGSARVHSCLLLHENFQGENRARAGAIVPRSGEYAARWD